MRNEIKMWQTHCDTVGDYFKNKCVFSIIQKWYRTKMTDEWIRVNDLKVWNNRKNKNAWFSDEYETFVRAIFRDKSEMEDFLAFLKEEYIDNPKMWKLLNNSFNYEDFIRLMLSFQEVFNQLEYDSYAQVDRLTIGFIFSKRITDLLDYSYGTDVTLWDDTPIHLSMKALLEKWISPISIDGEILCYLWEWENGGYMVKRLWDKVDAVFEIDANWKDIYAQLSWISEKWKKTTYTQEEYDLYKRFIAYHWDIDAVDLSEDEEQKYIDLKLEWTNLNRWLSDTEVAIRFAKFLQERKERMRIVLRNQSKIVDLQTWEAMWENQVPNMSPSEVPSNFKLYSVQQ